MTMSSDDVGRGLPSACLLLVCGVPGSGKTLFTKLLIEVGGKAHRSWRWLAVHFDDFYPLDTRTAQRQAMVKKDKQYIEYSHIHTYTIRN